MNWFRKIVQTYAFLILMSNQFQWIYRTTLYLVYDILEFVICMTTSNICFLRYGEQFTEEEANEFFNMMDTDGDGVS